MSVKSYLYSWIISASWITLNVVARDLVHEMYSNPKMQTSIIKVNSEFNKLIMHLSLQQQQLPCPAGCSCIVVDSALRSLCYGAQHSTVPRGFKENTTYLMLMSTNITQLLPRSFSHLSSLRTLQLFYNYQLSKHIGPRSFEGLENMENLVLYRNSISSIDAAAFIGLSSLTLLDISNNFWITELADQLFVELRSLEYLDISANNITKLPNQFHVGNNVLIYLDLSDNYITALPEQVFLLLAHLELINLRKNNIEALPKKVFFGLNRLTNLDLSMNYITNLPNNIFVGQNHLLHLDLSHNRINSLSDYIFSPLLSLEILFINHNRLYDLNSKAFVGMKRLNYLNVSNNKLQYCVTGCDNSVIDLNLPMLAKQDISHNDIEYEDIDQFNPTLREVLEELYMDGTLIHVAILQQLIKGSDPDAMLRSLVNLKTLSIRQCEIKTFFQTIEIFQNLQKLEVIDLSGVKLSKEYIQQNTSSLITAAVFENSSAILQLKMNWLDIGRLEHDVLKPLLNLKSLHLSGNRIESVNFSFLPSRLWRQLDEIDLSYNPFICDCQIMWFHYWLKTTNVRVKRKKNPSAYRCAYPEDKQGKYILNISGMNHCYAAVPDTFLPIICPILFTVSLVALISSFIHKFRWHVRYWQIHIQDLNRQYLQMIEQREFTYDAFVMYSSEDSNWIIQHLLPQLENDTVDSLRLCIHQRDWLGGALIMENIVESIDASRKCLMIVSNAFVTSNWCNYEMNLAQSRNITGDCSNTVLVLIEEIAPINMTPRLRLQMQRQTYIEWTEHEVGRTLFWTRLRQALKNPQQILVHELQPRGEIIELN